jgi:hypothetical protein
VLLRLLALARAAVELAEAEVAVRYEGAHAEFDSHWKSLAHVRGGRRFLAKLS